MSLKGIDASLAMILACADAALVADGAGTCTVATTIGAPAIGNCCECATGTNGELWGHLVRLYRGDRISGAEVRNRKPCQPAFWYAQYNLTLARCFPTVGEDGELPEPADRSAAATDLHNDAATIQMALNCCDEIDEPPLVEQIAVTTNPSGGCSILTVSVRVPVSMGRAHNQRDSE